MSSFARSVAFLLGLAIGACAFLPWTPALTGVEVPIGSLLDPSTSSSSTSIATSIGLPVIVAGVVVVVSCIVNSRALLIAGGLASVALPTAWILVNAISTGTGAVAVSQIKIGAYGAAIAGFMALILAAVAVDTRVPSLR